jgi:hypothetical protein
MSELKSNSGGADCLMVKNYLMQLKQAVENNYKNF